MFSTLDLQLDFEASAKKVSFDAEAVLMEPGRYVTHIPIVVKGCIRVLRQNEDGNETFLYYIMPGETCALSLTCCATLRPSEVKTIAEEDTTLWMIPIQKMEEWDGYREWKEFVARTYQTRFDNLLHVIDNIAFKHLDDRLWKYLVARSDAKESLVLHISHEEIASELNMHREAVTRLIKKLKELGYLETGRNFIKINENKII